MSGITACRRCGGSLGSAHVSERCATCPHCAAPLGDPTPAGLTVPDFSRDVSASGSRFRKMAFWFLACCALTIGLLMLLPTKGSTVMGDLFFLGMVVAFGVIDLVLIVAVIRWVHRAYATGEGDRAVGFVLFVILSVGMAAGIVIVGLCTCGYLEFNKALWEQ